MGGRKKFSKTNVDIVRQIRLQLKTGYMKTEPVEYTHLKRYPPLYRDGAPKFHKIQEKTVPYFDLYEDAVERNPLYNDEKVYPAFWQQEPQALTLAKKQYELMTKQKLDVNTAYEQAVKHVNDIEAESYESLRTVKSTLEAEGNTPLSYLNDPALAFEVKQWQDLLQTTNYEDLSDAHQGELDFLVQTKILKWSELERERRMKDPIFVLEFEGLRGALFEQGADLRTKTKKNERDQMKEGFFVLHDLNPQKLRAKEPFFVEDYLNFFYKCAKEPDLAKWDKTELDTFSKWIVSSLALLEILENQPKYKVVKYLDALRSQFFPVLRNPDRASELAATVGDVAKVKALLYRNDIGYKRAGEDMKIFVHRYYRIPSLLFPMEIFTNKLLSDEAMISEVQSEENGLLREIRNAGLDEATLPEIKRQLDEYLVGSRLRSPIYGNAGEEDFAMLDSILNDGFKDSRERDDEDNDAAEDGASLDETEMEDRWQKLMTQYRPEPVTSLEKERDRLYSLVEYDMFDEAENEMDLQRAKQKRLEHQIIAQARMHKKYETKEAARRAKSWEERGVVLGDAIPKPTLKLLE